MPSGEKMPGRCGFAAVPRNLPAGKVPVNSRPRSCRALGIARHSACIGVLRDHSGAGDVNLVEDDLGGDGARRTRRVLAVFRLSARTGSDSQVAGRGGSKPRPRGAIASGAEESAVTRFAPRGAHGALIKAP